MILAACGALTACSDGGDATVNRVDLNAAAARAEDDIANYAVITNAEGANDAIEARDRRPPRE